VGRIKTSFIKHIAQKLYKEHCDEFTTEFSKNKELLKKLMNIESKKVRNILAGYITHTMKKLERLSTIKVSYQPPLPNKRKRGRRRKR